MPPAAATPTRCGPKPTGGKETLLIRGVYTAASAMLAQETAQAAIANNLANVNTSGYKADVATFKSFSFGALTRSENGARQSIGTLGAGSAPDEIALDLTPGALQATGNNLDVALPNAREFFVVQTPTGARLTRAGAFHASANGTLVDATGFPLVGRDGRSVRLPSGGPPATIDAGGNVVGANGQVIGRLEVVRLAPGAKAEKEGGRLLRVDNPAALQTVDRPVLAVGSLETSNVSAVTEMVGMIAAMRAYEAASKVLQDEDETLGRALSEVARAG